MIYRYYSNTPGQVTFASTTNINQRLQFKNDVSVVKSEGVSYDLVRTGIVLTKPRIIAPIGCDDACGPHARGTDTVRIELSHKMGVGVEIIQSLKELVQFLEVNPSYVEGFNPPQTDISLPVLEEG